MTISNRVASLGNTVFYACTSLTNVTLPSQAVSIGSSAFYWCDSLVSLTVPNTVTNVGDWAFRYCASLTGVYFQGNAPAAGASVFAGADHAIAYYLPGTTNWGSTLANRPTLLWNPSIQASGPSFGVQTNRFGFNITGTTNIPIVVEACTTLASPSWTPLQNCTLTNGSIYFSDPTSMNYPGRYYRIRSP